MSKPFSVIFAGTPEFAVPSLEALAGDSTFDVQLILTQPDKPVGRKQELTPPPVKVIAEKLGLSVQQPENINDFEIPPCDYLVTVAYGQLLKQPVLDVPTISAVNVHPSLLPRWRGATPMQAALLAGDTETGTTIQKMTLALDAGDILAQQSVDVDARETIATLHDRLADLSATLLVDTLKQPLLSPTPQNNDDVTVCKKLSRDDGECDSSTMTAEEIDLRVRALVPWPGVTCTITDNEVKLLRTSLEVSDDAYELVCSDGSSLYIEELQPPGKTPMSGADWARGHQS